jgi:hypothetical protein
MALTASMPVPSHLFLNIVSQKSPLVLQFMLRDFMHIYRAIRDIERLCQKLKVSSRRQPFKGEDALTQEVLERLTTLCGGGYTLVPTMPWNTNQGRLLSFYHYCRVFTRQLPDKEKNQIRLSVTMEKAYRHAHSAREGLAGGLPPDEQGQQRICRSLLQLIDNVCGGARLIARVLRLFPEDETVLFFLLRYREEWDTLYRCPFVAQHFQKVHPDGIPGVERLLLERHMKRGFDQLLPQITHGIELLKIHS